jgi:hypothetical protein
MNGNSSFLVRSGPMAAAMVCMHLMDVILVIVLLFLLVFVFEIINECGNWIGFICHLNLLIKDLILQ